MTDRSVIMTMKSDKVHGANTWVKIRVYTRGEAKKVQSQAYGYQARMDAATTQEEKLAIKEEIDQFDNSILAERIVEWNWTSDGSTPLPLPKNDPTVLDQLTNAEFQWLSSRLN